MLTREQTEFFLVKAYNAALRAGARILDIYNDGVDIEVNLKSDRTPITLADCESHTLIKSYLGPTHIPLLSEEGRDLLYEERRNWDLFWMVDPLDGTKEFIKGNGEFTVNIALMYNNRPEIGVIYVPYIHKMYFAIRGVGSFRKTEVLPDPESEKSLAEILEGREPLPLVEAANPHCREPLAQYRRDVRAYLAHQAALSVGCRDPAGQLLQVLPAGRSGRRCLCPYVSYQRMGYCRRRGHPARIGRPGREYYGRSARL